MLYFSSRSKARTFANNKGKKFIDNGINATDGKRWAVKVL